MEEVVEPEKLEKRGRGRPRLVLENGKFVSPRGARITKKWEPKEWRPEYEAIVALSCTGLSNTALGERFGYGKQQISNILNTPMGVKLREIIVSNLRATNNKTLGSRLDNLKENALQRVESVMKDDKLFERAPLAVFDRSIAILKTTGVVSEKNESSGNTYIQNAMILNGAESSTLKEGLKKADEVKKLMEAKKEDGQRPITRSA